MLASAGYSFCVPVSKSTFSVWDILCSPVQWSIRRCMRIRRRTVRFLRMFLTRLTYIHTYIDCGKNVKLFKAIAAINDATDYGQVFVSTSGWTLCPFNVFPVTPKTEGFRKATAEELIQRIDEICF